MSRIRKLSQSIWHCQYHIVFVPKYRFKILTGEVAKETEHCIRAFTEHQGGSIIEINIQLDHVHMLAMVPPKVSISNFVGTIKGRTAIRIFNKFNRLKKKPYWGNHFWSRGYCVDTVGLDAEMIRKYVRYQDEQRRKARATRAVILKIKGATPFASSRGKAVHSLLGVNQNRPLWGRISI